MAYFFQVENVMIVFSSTVSCDVRSASLHMCIMQLVYTVHSDNKQAKLIISWFS